MKTEKMRQAIPGGQTEGAIPFETVSPLDMITWDISFPLLTSRFFIYDMFKITIITFLIVSGILAGIFAFQANRGQLAGVLGIIGIIALGFLGMYMLVSLLWFGNRSETRFTVSKKGIFAEMIRNRDKVVNRALVILGLLTGNPRIAGTGLIAMSRESVGIQWDKVHKVKEYPMPRVITIMDSWHVVLRLYCTPENYGQVIEAVRAYAEEGREKREKQEAGAGPSQVPRLLRSSGLAFVASFMLFAAPYPFEIKPLFVAVSLGSVLLGLWMPTMKRFLGALSLAVIAAIGYLIAAEGFRTKYHHRVMLKSGGFFEFGKYFSFQTMDAGDWLRLASVVGGLIILGFLAAQMLLRNMVGIQNKHEEGRKRE